MKPDGGKEGPSSEQKRWRKVDNSEKNKMQIQKKK